MSEAQFTLPGDLQLIDIHHLGRPHVIATYLLPGDEPAIVDPGPASALNNLEAGLAAHGLRFNDLSAVILTHIHLDHAGATGVLVERYPHLRVYVHERGAPHVVDPSKLVNSATRLYGDMMETLWGDIRPIPAEKLKPLAGGETFRLGQRTLSATDAPGHASHHLIYLDQTTGAAFVGDNAGIRVPRMATPAPATPPPDLDIEVWNTTLDKLLALQPTALLLTHFGPGIEPNEHVAILRQRLAEWAELARQGLLSGADEATQIAALVRAAAAELPADASAEDRTTFQQAAPIEQCWYGLARYWRKRGVGTT
jgi:glyoxylase-like metal-dependent hydrolase (beta-lactamase superfamily II)